MCRDKRIRLLDRAAVHHPPPRPRPTKRRKERGGRAIDTPSARCKDYTDARAPSPAPTPPQTKASGRRALSCPIQPAKFFRPPSPTDPNRCPWTTPPSGCCAESRTPAPRDLRRMYLDSCSLKYSQRTLYTVFSSIIC